MAEMSGIIEPTAAKLVFQRDFVATQIHEELRVSHLIVSKNFFKSRSRQHTGDYDGWGIIIKI